MTYRLALMLVAACTVLAIASPRAIAADTISSAAPPELAPVRGKIKAREFASALADLKVMADKVQHADVYNLLGFCLRKTGDYTTALTYYKKALDFDPDHKSAHEYLGELYVETGQMPKAREHLAILVRLCPGGCEEREDLEKAIAEAKPSAAKIN